MTKKKMNSLVHSSQKFTPPTYQEIKNQFELKGILGDTEPQKYQAHYESNGWMVGRAKMRSWRASIAGWVLRMNQYNKQPQKTPMSTQERREFFYENLKDIKF